MSEQIEARPASSGHPTSWLERLWSSIADRGRDYANVPAASLPPGERARRLAAALLSGRGEASGFGGGGIAGGFGFELELGGVGQRLDPVPFRIRHGLEQRFQRFPARGF